MPLDASLNKDIDDAVARHVAFCSLMLPSDDDYDKRFSRLTPKLQGSAYLRIYDPAHGPHGGAPVSIRICQDVEKFVVALKAISTARGIAIPDLGTRNGHRATAGAGSRPRGGVREKNATTAEQFVHADAIGPRARRIVMSKERHAGDIPDA